MDLRVFVSSTCKDLEQDCRPTAIEAVRFSEAVPVAMETWASPYKHALELCREKVQSESTHYLGLFGYYRGWVPEAEVSITEAEFGWALHRHQGSDRMVMFVPKETTSLARRLRGRADRLQGKDQSAAQLAFLRRVLSLGSVEQFEDVVHLGMRVVRAVKRWEHGPLRAQLGAAQHLPVPQDRRRRPTPHDLQGLGRRAHVLMFATALERLAGPRAGNAACVVICGPKGFGHRELAERLATEADRNTWVQAQRHVAGIGVLWRDTGLSNLVRVIGKQIKPGWRPGSVGELGAALDGCLQRSDVIVQITGLQHFQGGLDGFRARFWEPLVAELGQVTDYRLLCLVCLEGDTRIGHAAGGAATPRLPDDLAAAIPIMLPALARLREAEVATWLRQWLAPADAADLAATLIEETSGVPHLLHAALLDPSVWAVVGDDPLSGGRGPSASEAAGTRRVD
jgi:hypothetical protein